MEPRMGSQDEEDDRGERCLCSSVSQRSCIALAVTQVVLTILGLGFSVMPWMDNNSLCSQNHILCLADLHRHSWWLAPPTSFWAGVAGLCMLRGQQAKSWCKSWWLSTSFDLQIMVAPVSALCFILLGWQALWIRHVHFSGCVHGSHTESVTHSEGDLYGEILSEPLAVLSHSGDAGCGAYPSRAVFTYAGLSIVMQIQAACAVCAAMAMRGGRMESHMAPDVSRGSSYGSSSSGRKGGWRKRINADGRTFYEHKRTGRVQYEPPITTVPSSDVEEARSDVSGCEGRLPRVDET